MKLNCDIGEGLDDIDASIMPFIDQASIACGGHVGNAQTMLKTIALAAKHGVEIGAHPSYPDKENFGRKRLNMASDTLEASLNTQINALKTIADNANYTLKFIKPHGALYNDAVRDNSLFQLLLRVANNFKLPLLIQALPKHHNTHLFVQQTSIPIMYEAFVDRRYTNEGFLVSRQYRHAVIESEAQLIQQAKSLIDHQQVLSHEGKRIELIFSSLCIHSDTLNAKRACLIVKNIINGNL